MYKRNYRFRTIIMEEIFEIRSCIKIFWQMISKSKHNWSACSTVNKELQSNLLARVTTIISGWMVKE